MTIPRPVAAAHPAGSSELHSSASWQHRADVAEHTARDDSAYLNVEWIFGFGSLISHPGFEHSDVVRPCYIKGYRRVFWQGSTDHRGTPEAPGRTVTLEPCEGAITWGAVFKLAGDAEQRRQTWQYLEWREKQYDLRAQVEVYCPTSGDGSGSISGGSSDSLASSDGEGVAVLTALTFIATSNKAANPNYLGPAPLEDIAHQIATSRGPSGPNYEYLFRLAGAMRSMGVVDGDLFELEAKVRAHMQLLELGGGSASQAAAMPIEDGAAEPEASLPIEVATQPAGDVQVQEAQPNGVAVQ